MKQAIAGVLAVGFGVMALYIGQTRSPSGNNAAASIVALNPEQKVASTPLELRHEDPAAVVSSLLDAAEAGDVAVFRSWLIGRRQEQFDQGAAAENNSGAALAKSFWGLQGRAVMAAQPNGNDTRTVDVEFQYRDRKEGQRFYLRLTAEGWRIERIDPARALEQTIPYGTPVNQAGPYRDEAR